MKLRSKIAAGIAAAFLFTSAFIGFGPNPCVTRWEGMIQADFVQQVRDDLSKAQGCKVLRVELLSPGGSVIHTLEAVHAMREAEATGLIIEIHGGALIASGATFVLGAGSRGHRYARRFSLALVHGVQRASMFSQACYEFNPEAKSDEDKITNHLIQMLIQEYALITGKSLGEISEWLKCGNSQIGYGTMLVKLGIADHDEE